MGKLVWKVMALGSARVADLTARKLVTSGWTATVGKPPPDQPNDPQVSWLKAVGWAVASGAVIEVARVLAIRQAAAYYTKSAGHPPEGFRELETG